MAKIPIARIDKCGNVTYYESIADAARQNNLEAKRISENYRGLTLLKFERYGGYYWRCPWGWETHLTVEGVLKYIKENS